jgi:hypothetical protein
MIRGKVRANTIALFPAFHIFSYSYNLTSHVGAGDKVIWSAS